MIKTEHSKRFGAMVVHGMGEVKKLKI